MVPAGAGVADEMVVNVWEGFANISRMSDTSYVETTYRREISRILYAVALNEDNSDVSPCLLRRS